MKFHCVFHPFLFGFEINPTRKLAPIQQATIGSYPLMKFTVVGAIECLQHQEFEKFVAGVSVFTVFSNMNVQSFFLKVLFIAIFAFELSYFCNVCLFNTVFMRVIVMPLETLQPAERFVTIFAIEGLIVFSCRVGVSLFCTFEICGADFALMKKTTIGTCLKRYSERNSSELVVHYMNSQTFHTVINNMSFQANFRKISLATVLAHKSLIMRSPSWLL